MHPQQYETKTRAHAVSASDTEGLGRASSVAQLCPTLGEPLDGSPPGSSVHGDSPGRNAGVGCHALLQGIFPTQGWNPGVLHLQADSLPISHQGSHLGAGDQSRVSDLTSRGRRGSQPISWGPGRSHSPRWWWVAGGGYDLRRAPRRCPWRGSAERCQTPLGRRHYTLGCREVRVPRAGVCAGRHVLLGCTAIVSSLFCRASLCPHTEKKAHSVCGPTDHPGEG